MLRRRSTCRVCGSSLVPVLSLGDQYLAGNFSLSADFPPVERRIPLDLVRCSPETDERACGLVQLRHTVPGDLMFTSYGYRSGINEAMVLHLRGLARQAEERIQGLKQDDVVVDIGANDGTTLGQYEAKHARYVGFEPSLLPPAEGMRKIEIIRDYFSAQSFKEHSGKERARIVTSVAMFYDLENPREFVANVGAILSRDGIWVVELHYLPAMLRQNSFDAICHEHLTYYSLSSLERALDGSGLGVVDAEENASNGGSLRVTIAPAGGRFAERSPAARARIYRLKKHELELGLESDGVYEAFSQRIERVRDDLRRLLGDIRRAGKKVHGYGASTKGNVILQYCGIGPDLVEAIADRNPEKVGGRTLGSGIPVVSEDDTRRARPDFLLVLPWHLVDAFIAREQTLLASGTKLIVPLPEVRIVP